MSKLCAESGQNLSKKKGCATIAPQWRFFLMAESSKIRMPAESPFTSLLLQHHPRLETPLHSFTKRFAITLQGVSGSKKREKKKKKRRENPARFFSNLNDDHGGDLAIIMAEGVHGNPVDMVLVVLRLGGHGAAGKLGKVVRGLRQRRRKL